MMSSKSIPLEMPSPSSKRRRNEDDQIDFDRVTGEEEELWSGYSENEEEVGPSNKECDEIDTIEDGNEATENCEDRVEEPKVGMTFDSLDEAYFYYLDKAYFYYCQFAKEKGFAVCKRTSRKGKDGKLSYVTLSCSRGGKAKLTTSNLAKSRPQSKIDCPAHVTVVIPPDGKWRLNWIVLEHNHVQSPSKVRYFKCNRVLDEHVKRKLELNDKAEINLNKTYDSLQIEAGGPGKLPYGQKDCRNYVDKVRRSLVKEGDAEAMHKYFMKMKSDNSDFFFCNGYG
ncbi:hypothetical protein RHMOL_Rhmol01G0222700 [Rhododendron molle]|uniref:Uncharacterized protein n=1 Tax=Rhododendron molle TaxID=49168 RepID=A0ACC0Q3Y9_RHOML|nr:hypothetical protein RHMOL_Rhmol01G0222700 [Rhododendron molle]